LRRYIYGYAHVEKIALYSIYSQ